MSCIMAVPLVIDAVQGKFLSVAGVEGVTLSQTWDWSQYGGPGITSTLNEQLIDVGGPGMTLYLLLLVLLKTCF